MDDRTIARTQARLIRTALTSTGLGARDLWLRYVHLGGEVGELELDAYLHHSMLLPRLVSTETYPASEAAVKSSAEAEEELSASRDQRDAAKVALEEAEDA